MLTFLSLALGRILKEFSTNMQQICVSMCQILVYNKNIRGMCWSMLVSLLIIKVAKPCTVIVKAVTL